MTKCLTVHQPWASLICSGINDIKNSTWKTKFRGRVLIHAGFSQLKLYDIFTSEQSKEIRKSINDEMLDLMLDYDLPLGSIIGSIEIVDCVINHPSIWAEKTDVNAVYALGYKPVYNWVLANPILFEKPIPAKGKLSFWEFDETLIK